MLRDMEMKAVGWRLCSSVVEVGEVSMFCGTF
jgi:hypothetical protein